jgi:hypothetical protein
MINKEKIAQYVKELPRLLVVALLVSLLAACDSGPTTGGTGNTSGGETTEPNIIDVNEVLGELGVPTVKPPADGKVPLFAP